MDPKPGNHHTKKYMDIQYQNYSKSYYWIREHLTKEKQWTNATASIRHKEKTFYYRSDTHNNRNYRSTIWEKTNLPLKYENQS